MSETKIGIKNEPTELCKILKIADMAGSGGEAKHLINEGSVILNGAVETRKRKKVFFGDTVECAGQTLKIIRSESGQSWKY